MDGRGALNPKSAVVARQRRRVVRLRTDEALVEFPPRPTTRRSGSRRNAPGPGAIVIEDGMVKAQADQAQMTQLSPAQFGGKPIDPRAAERDAADKGRRVLIRVAGLARRRIRRPRSAGQIEDMRNAFSGRGACSAA